MEQKPTRQRILIEALHLFAQEGYDAVTVEQIAGAVGIKAPSLYKHYQSKRDIFDHILLQMEQQDGENAAACSLPKGPRDTMPDAYERSSLAELVDFSRQQFRYWTEDPFASDFRKMLTLEQYRSPEMNALYHQYLGAGPLQYTADLLGSQEKALAFYGPMHLLYSVYDQTADREAVLALLDRHLSGWLL